MATNVAYILSDPEKSLRHQPASVCCVASHDDMHRWAMGDIVKLQWRSVQVDLQSADDMLCFGLGSAPPMLWLVRGPRG